MCMSNPQNSVTFESLPIVLDMLRSAPAKLAEAMLAFNDASLCRQPSPGLFSPLETAWHLRDIEVEGYALRIASILCEDDPLLIDLDGDRLAIERAYNQLAVAPALQGFAEARAQSIKLLAGIDAAALCKPGHYRDQTLTLGVLIQRMVQHDSEHLLDLERQSRG